MMALIALLISLVNPMQCLGDVDNAVFIDLDLRGQAVADWQAVVALDMQDIWLGYDAGGFDVPDDERIFGLIDGTVDGETIRVWLTDSPTTNAIYVYAFTADGLIARADAEGNHYGIHPCGVGRMDKGKFMSVLIGGG